MNWMWFYVLPSRSRSCHYPFIDIKRYAANPNAYVAAKCYVTEEDYLRWLQHYENRFVSM